MHGDRPEFRSYLVCLHVYPSFPPRVGMVTPREELGGAHINGSTMLAGGVNSKRGGERSTLTKGYGSNGRDRTTKNIVA